MDEKVVMQDRQEQLAHAYLQEFLRREGYSFETIGQLPPAELKQLMIRASILISTKLAEIDDRAEMVTSLHHATESLV